MDEEFDNITFHSQNELLGFLKQSYFAHQSTIRALREDKARLERLLTKRAADLLICPACKGVGGDCEYCVDGFLAPNASR